MTVAMCAHIIFDDTDRRGAVSFRKVSEVEIKSSVHDVCQSATVKLPLHIPEFETTALKDLVRRGDPVRILLGYDGDLVEEFSGFVTRVGADVPAVIECRDAIWKVLQQPFNKGYSQTSVPVLLRDLVGDSFKLQALDATIGPTRWVKTTVAKVLKVLADDYGLLTYLKGDTVFCGVLYDAEARTVTYDETRNVKSSDLKYRIADEVKLKVTAESVKGNGEKISVEVGDPDGEQRTLSYYGIGSEAELKKLAEMDMQKFRYDGYEGGFKGFGIPFIQYGDKAHLASADHPERDGEYLAEAITVTFAPSGFQRDIKLAQRWSS